MVLELLYHFQELEIRETEVRHKIKALPQLKELKLMKENFEANQESLKEKRVKLQAECLSLKILERKVAASEKQKEEMSKLLYSGSINSPKELENLESQIEVLKDQTSNITNEVITRMEQKEESEQEIERLTTELKDQYQKFNKLKNTYQITKINLEQELAAMIEDKEELISRIDEESMAWYHNKKKNFNGTPVGKIMENHACSGCRTVISAVIVKNARMNQEKVFCETCGRVLFAPSSR